MKRMRATRYGFYWRYNVVQGDVEITSMGRVFYVMDDFGSLVMVNERRLNFSIQ